MDKDQLKQNIKEIESQLAEMKQQLESKDFKSFPQPGDRYYSCLPSGSVSTFLCEAHQPYPLEASRTEEGAKQAFALSCAKKRVKDRIEELNEGWTPDWNAEKQLKFFHTKKHLAIVTDYCYSVKYQPTYMYMKSRAIAGQILSEMEDDLLLIIKE